MCERMPTQWEQDIAYAYVNERQLDREITNIFKPLFLFLFFIFFTGLILWIIDFVANNLGILSYIPIRVQLFYINHPLLSKAFIIFAVVTIEAFFCFKYILIGVIRLYQYYAPDEMRRRCLYMPTCSEYAVLALQKYGIVIGIYKSYYRLVHQCRGSTYQIDYP